MPGALLGVCGRMYAVFQLLRTASFHAVDLLYYRAHKYPALGVFFAPSQAYSNCMTHSLKASLRCRQLCLRGFGPDFVIAVVQQATRPIFLTIETCPQRPSS